MPTSSHTGLRIAMWSGPRNISTALMRSWGNRSDTAVCDEPLYAHYLAATGLDHPGRDEVLGHHETDWRRVVRSLLGPIPDDKPIYYQKHMAHHLLPDIDRDWLLGLTHCFLIRSPREMLVSLIKRWRNPTISDTGLPQQMEIVRALRDHTGRTPPVVDAHDILLDPRRLLTLLCNALGVAFTESMLQWPSGRRPTDGIWARHWYSEVERSTGFQPPHDMKGEVPVALRPLLDECLVHYHALHEMRLH